MHLRLPASPYLPLLPARRVRARRLACAGRGRRPRGRAGQLREQGVYVRFEESKGRQPIVRGSLRYEVDVATSTTHGSEALRGNRPAARPDRDASADRSRLHRRTSRRSSCSSKRRRASAGRRASASAARFPSRPGSAAACAARARADFPSAGSRRCSIRRADRAALPPRAPLRDDGGLAVRGPHAAPRADPHGRGRNHRPLGARWRRSGRRECGRLHAEHGAPHRRGGGRGGHRPQRASFSAPTARR